MLLTEKFQLFNGVFGASDEVLGRVESGIDFEKRVLQIYDSCRLPIEIETAFDALQQELEDSIINRVRETQERLLEAFDEDVHDRLKLRLNEAEARLDKLGRWFWGVTCFTLDGRARFDEQAYAFYLQEPPDGVAVGHYQLVRGAAQPDLLAHAYRLNHPLGEWSLEQGLQTQTPLAMLHLDYSRHKSRISVVEQLQGQTGWLTLVHLQMSAVETSDALLFSGMTDRGQLLDQDLCEKLMSLQAKGKPFACQQAVPEMLLANSKQQVSACIAGFMESNQRLFNEERDKLEHWAEDKLQAAEDALKQTKARLAQLRRDARNAITLQEQEGVQREISELERKQRRQRQEIFIVEDEIIEQRDALIDSLQQRLQEKTEQKILFSIRWKVV